MYPGDKQSAQETAQEGNETAQVFQYSAPSPLGNVVITSCQARRPNRPDVPSISLDHQDETVDGLGFSLHRTAVSRQITKKLQVHLPRTPSTPTSNQFYGPWHGRYSDTSSSSKSSSPASTMSSPEDVKPLLLLGDHDGASISPGTKLYYGLATPDSPEISAGSPQISDQRLTRRHTFPRRRRMQDGSKAPLSGDSSTSEQLEAASQTQLVSLKTDGSPLKVTAEATSLEDAITSQQHESVADFLNAGCHPDGDKESGVIPLILASSTGNEKVVRLLLSAGASINVQDSGKGTALHHASAGGHRGVVKLLLVAGADMFTRTDAGLLPVQVTSDSRIRHLLACRMRSLAEGDLAEGSNSEDGAANLTQEAETLAQKLLEHHSEVPRIEPAEHDEALKKEQEEINRSDEKKASSNEGSLARRKSVKFAEEEPSTSKSKDEDAKSEKAESEPSETLEQKLFHEPVAKELTTFKWTRGELLGEGAYGKVYAGLNQSTGELMAVKQLKIDPGEGQDKAFYLAALEREIALYKKLRHKHIVGYINMEQDLDNDTLYIFLEYVSGGSIQSMLERFGRFSEPLIRVYTRQLLLGLHYLHSNRIVHRDIKGGNVLVDSVGVVKLADFGASKAFQDPTITDGCKSIRGSVFWMAPEVIKGDGYGRRADIWSVGCTVIEMLTATHPWPGIDNTWSAIFHIAKASGGPPIPDDASDCAKDFIQNCFQMDPKLRPRADELLEHPFVALPDADSE